MAEIALFALDHAAAARLAMDPAGFAASYAIALAPHQATAVAIAANTSRLLRVDGTPTRWGGYLALAGPTRRVVGACGFKGQPDADGVVEIAYFTFPGEEGHGVATAMAGALVQVAVQGAGAGKPDVTAVRAHTLPERNASCRVLEKVAFQLSGDVIDPDDGRVWRWERALGSGSGV